MAQASTHPSQGEVWALLSQKQAPGPEAAQCGLVLGREDSWCGLHPGMELGFLAGTAKNAVLPNDQAHKEVSIRKLGSPQPAFPGLSNL